MKIVAGPNSQMLAARVAKEIECELVLTDIRDFPDGEIYTRVCGDVEGENVTVIQSTINTRDVMCMFQLLDACDKADKINLVIPYFGYARQDRRFNPGEAVSAKVIAEKIAADRILTINIHNPRVMKYFNSPCFNLDAAPLIGRYIRHLGLRDPIVIGPDDGALELAKTIASQADIEYDVLDKVRIDSEKVEIQPKYVSVANRDVVIVDDIISTGGTIAEAAKILNLQSPHSVYVACIHPVLVGNAVVKIFRSGIMDFFSTDTIDRSVGKVSVSQLIVKALKK